MVSLKHKLKCFLSTYIKFQNLQKYSNLQLPEMAKINNYLKFRTIYFKSIFYKKWHLKFWTYFHKNCQKLGANSLNITFLILGGVSQGMLFSQPGFRELG